MSERRLHRFTVDDYHRMAESGLINKDDRVVLIRGILVQKMTMHPPHAYVMMKLAPWIEKNLPAGWVPRFQLPLTLRALGSEPEPDLTVVVGDAERYSRSHPLPHDVGLLVEVADSSLEEDRVDALALYAESGIREFWIVNIPDGQVEVYSLPTGSSYESRKDYPRGGAVPLILDDKTVAMLKVDDIMPR